MAISHRIYRVTAIATTLSGFLLVVNLTSCTAVTDASTPDHVLASSTEEQFHTLHTSGIQKALQENYESAILDYNQAILLFKDNPEVYYNRAVAYYSVGNSKLALQDLDHAIQLQSTMAEAFANRSMIRLELGDLTGAHTDAQQAADLFAQQGNLEHAEQMQTWIKQQETTSHR